MKRFIAAWFSRRPPAPETVALCALPMALPMAEARRVLVFAPHPDDECIGCGGLIARLVQAGVALRVVLVTDGSGAGGLPAGSDLVRQHEFRASLQRLGVSEHGMLGFPDGGLLDSSPLHAAVEHEVRAFAPNWVVMPSAADAHRDHRRVARVVRRAALAQRGVETLLQYETWGPLPASHVLDITDVLGIKLAALGEHVTALQQMDYAAATIGLARYRALLLPQARPEAAAEAYLLTHRETGFDWPPGLGRPEGWPT